MLRLNIFIGLLILFGTSLAENLIQHRELHHHTSRINDHTSRTGRFGFNILENLRQNFCRSNFCMSADTMPYLTNLMCAAKCPELYLPHGTTASTTESTSTSTTTSPTSPISSTTPSGTTTSTATTGTATTGTTTTGTATTSSTTVTMSSTSPTSTTTPTSNMPSMSS